MAFESQHFMLKYFRGFQNFPVFRRTYARGSRFLPPKHVNEQDRDFEEKHKQATINKPEESNDYLHYTKESPKDLLENAASFQESKRASKMEDIWDSGPYPKNSNWQQSQAKHSQRPTCDPRDTSIILFPGQGNFIKVQKYQTYS
jgi:hypothetical protein